MVSYFISRITHPDVLFITSFLENFIKFTVKHELYLEEQQIKHLQPCQKCAEPQVIFQNIIETDKLKNTSG